MKIATRKEIRKIDEQSIKKYKIPSIVLMENAGRSTAQIIASEYPNKKSIAIFCGNGNNGGDGMVIARHRMTARAARNPL